MFRSITAVSVLLISANASFSGTDKEKEAEFFAGVTLLQQKTDLKPEEKAAKFRELESLTGVSAAEAKRVLEQYRDRPEEWKKMDSVMVKLLSDTRLEFHKNDSVNAAVKDTGKKAQQTLQNRNSKIDSAALRGKDFKGMTNPAKPTPSPLAKTKR